MISQETDSTFANHACSACKKQKRRCDKRLPQCSLCLRMGRDCDYNEPLSLPVDSPQALQDRISELETLLLQRNQQISQLSSESPESRQSYNPAARVISPNPCETFPSSFFLDYEIFGQARPSIPRPKPPIPEDVYRIMGDIDGLKKIADGWFTTIHTWFPILSKKRMELLLTDAGFELTPDIALLFSTMHLLTEEKPSASPNVRNNVYWTVKNYAVALEVNAVMTPRLLQSKVLIAIYEIGHGIYPAAYLSIGSCATFGKALGLDNRKDSPQMLRRFGAWAEQEELRRLWWAVLILDRYVHLGTRGHTLFTEDPHRNGSLPADDVQFDLAEIAVSEPLYVTSPTSVKAGPFTRACQAAYLIGKVVNALNELSAEAETRWTNALQIYRILCPFVKVVKEEFARAPDKFATAMALAHSAMISLCDPFICTIMDNGAHTPEETELQTYFIDGLMVASNDIVTFGAQLKYSMTQRPAAISALVANCLYLGTINCAWRVYEGERGASIESYNNLREALRTLNGRWAVGGEYLDCIEKSKQTLYPSPLL